MKQQILSGYYLPIVFANPTCSYCRFFHPWAKSFLTDSAMLTAKQAPADAGG